MVLPLIAFITQAIANLLLAAFVIRRNSKSATHVLFSLLALALVVWATFNYLSIEASGYTAALWLVRLVMAFAVIQSVLFALLLSTVPRSRLPLSRNGLYAVLGTTAAGVAIALSPWLVRSITFATNSIPAPEFGPGLILFVPITLGALSWGAFLLLKRNIQATGIERIQQRYLLVGLGTTFALLVVFVLYFNVIRADNQFVPFAPLFTLPFIGLTAYAIIRYRMMDIRVAVARSLSFSMLVGVFVAIYSVLLVFAVPFVSNSIGISNSIVGAVAAFAAVALAQYTQQYLRRVTDKVFFQDHTDFHTALVRISQRLSRTIEIKEVTTVVIQALQRYVRSKKMFIYLQESSGSEYVPEAAEGAQLSHVSIPVTNALVEQLKRTSASIVRDELLRHIEEEANEKRQKELEEVAKAMEWMDAQVAVPLFIEKGLTGFILLSEKLSGQPYLRDDLEFLGALAPQAATALENARLYQESLEFAERLKLEVHRATAELEVANRQLKDLDKAKSEFLSIASHQLYTPLTAIRGYLSMLKEGDYGKVSEKQEPVVEIIEKSSNRLIELIKNLLDISRIESGRLELQLEETNLAALAKELVQDIMPNAMKKDLQLIFHPPRETVGKVIADRQRIRQVLLNFIDNAIKYTQRGHIDVTVQQIGQDIVFSVTDTGKGITRDEIARLFTKFTRVGGASRFHTEGTGLGLYVARQIVREHHGEVEVTSPGPGKGSTFTMRMPVAGSVKSLKLGDEASVVIKAAEAGK